MQACFEVEGQDGRKTDREQEISFHGRGCLAQGRIPVVRGLLVVGTRIVRIESVPGIRPGLGCRGPEVVRERRRVGLVFQKVRRLALQELADGLEGAETNGLGSSGFKHRQVLWGDVDGRGEVVESAFSPGQHDIEMDDDGHMAGKRCAQTVRDCSSAIRCASSMIQAIRQMKRPAKVISPK